MTKKLKIILFTIFIIVGCTSLTLYTELQNQKQQLQKRVDNRAKNIDYLIKMRQKNLIRVYTIRLNNIIKDSDFITHIKSNDISSLQKLLKNRYQAMQQERMGVDTLQLLSTDNTSLYRAHKPSKYGDNLTDIRELIAKANRTKQPQQGYEEGLYRVNYRVVLPIIYDNVHYGVLELGIDLRHVAKIIENIFKDSMTIILFNKKELEYFRAKSSLDKFDDNYLTFYKHKNLKDIKIDLSKKYISINNKIYSPKMDNTKISFGNKDTLVKIAYFFDVTEEIRDYQNTKDRILTGTLILIVLTTVLLYISFTLYEKELEELYKENIEKDKMLHQQSKLAVMGEMLSMIAHQWRQPLNIINAIIMTINIKKTKEELDDEELTKNLNSIKETTTYLTNTISDFRKFFDKDREADNTRVDSIFDKSISIINHRVSKDSVDIITNIEYTSAINTYKNEIQQIFLNIINNSLDEFESRSIAHPKILFSLKEVDKDYILATISDNAGGIDESVLERVFEPYISTKSKNGTGLGLYMSKVIVEEHLGGILSVENINGGASFSIKLKKEI
jgi:signal transduction histidine kinase